MSVEVNKYRKCLYDILKRTEVINHYIQGVKTTGYLGTDIELIALQFRKIIELIALSSLVANKKEYAAMRSKFREDWNARLIFQDLERVNPEFYPKPSKQIEKVNSEGVKYFEFEPIEAGYLSKKEAIKIYEKCGGVLHAENPFRESKDIMQLQKQFPFWIKKIMTLMNHHSIILANKNMVVGLMKGKNDGLPHVTLFGLAENQNIKQFKE
ncbi:hypothetical protein [Plebeiibacterium sediminum]|uniref:Uncharacterized protein n=1 Tax=Plebeiibacterium sediminum TaxID=2992112 RepID=A0AAE3SF94_9BACT|nr:hypothetical protein [Plebeiobacterium sediminum]MCW3787260.1 hypothetical protein [Plebeiobacterium sediminum]